MERNRYEIEVVVKLTIEADDAREAKEQAVRFARLATGADEATWISCKGADNGNSVD